MATKRKSSAKKYLEDLSGASLTLGVLLESIREADKLSQIDFAKRLRISPSHLCDIEKGRKVLSPDRAARFAKLLGFSEAQFVRLALQGLLDQAGIRLKIEVRAA